jgi:hypothetical protein
MMVSTILQKSECAFVYGVNECSIDSIQISDCYTSSLERDFRALDIFPQCDNTITVVELGKGSMLASLWDLLGTILSIRGDQLTRNIGMNSV